MMFRFFLFFSLLATSAYCQAPAVTVAVAANAQYAIKEIAAAYEKETGHQLQLIVGSSGKLTAQIKEGAPFDVFLAADFSYPTALYQSGHTVSKPRLYAYGVLVLWTLKPMQPLSIQALQLPSIKKVAIANPKTAPYGEAALEALAYYKDYSQLEPRLVYGESLAQVSQYIYTQAADAGFTAKSVVVSPQMQGKGTWIEVDPAAYKPLAQGAVLLKSAATRNGAGAKQFYAYLFSEKAQLIFKKYGYRLPHE